ncbi:MAG: polysaccharide deacetylase family protein [Elusimicrobia bacterium]|nr:polysaccharide deacetylase family protein [Elusimicrobiota bacterium]
MSWLIGAGLVAGAVFSVRWNWWRRTRRGLPILMYHKIGHPPRGSRLRSLWVAPEIFARQLETLRRWGYEPIGFQDLKDFREGSKPLPEKPVLLTFDDGYRNIYTQAFPILKRLKMKATIFLVVRELGGENLWHDPAAESRIAMLSWQEVREMAEAGVEFGSHTMTHPNLTGLDGEKLDWELKASRRAIVENTGKAPLAFAYPYGAGEDSLELRRKVQEAGYEFQCGIHSGIAPTLQTALGGPLPRLFIRGGDTRLDFYLNLTRGRARL